MIACDSDLFALVEQLKQKTMAEFFAGIGLVRLGLEVAGWQTLFANDFDLEKNKMYRGHFSTDEPSLLSAKSIEDISPGEVPMVTLATVSFPCNDLSDAGNRGGIHGQNSGAFWHFMTILEKLEKRRPLILLFENVYGFLSVNNGADLEKALLSINAAGYVVDVFSVNALRFVPQSRKRIFIVAVRKELLESSSLPRNFTASYLRPQSLVQFMKKKSQIEWSVRMVPDPVDEKPSIKDIIEVLDFDSQEWWSTERAEYLLSQMSDAHRAIADKMISGGEIVYGTIFRRMRNKKSTAELRADGIAGCLRVPRGGSAEQILFVAGHNGYRVRHFTVREAARLMGADNYVMNVSTKSALTGFGDAVCVPVITWIARSYIDSLIEDILSKYNLATAKQVS